MKFIKKIKKMIERKITNLLLLDEVEEIIEDIRKTNFRGIRMDDAIVVYNIGIVLFNKSLIYGDVISPLAKFIFDEFGYRANIEYIYSDPDNLNVFDYIIAVCGYSENDEKFSKEIAMHKLDKIENAIHLEFSRLDRFKDITDMIKYPCIVMKNVKCTDYEDLVPVVKHMTEKEELTEKVNNVLRTFEQSMISEEKLKSNLLESIVTRNIHFPVRILLVNMETPDLIKRCINDTVETISNEISEPKYRKYLKVITIATYYTTSAIINDIKLFDYLILPTASEDYAYIGRIQSICKANKFELDFAYSNCEIYYNKKHSDIKKNGWF